jgi:hypothetical protein
MISKDYVDILAPLNYWGKDQFTGIPRRAPLDKIDKMEQIKDLALFITGVRRVGKTILSKQYLSNLISNGTRKEATLYVNLDEPSFQPIMSNDLLDNIYSSYRHYVFPEGKAIIVLDEIQNIRGWERWIRSKMDKGDDCFFIITGSSSSIMSVEIGTLLTGRYIEQRVWPLNLREYLDFTEAPEYLTQEMKESILLSYFQDGGFPSIVLTKDPSIKRDLLDDLYMAMINRDLISRFGIRNSEDIRGLVPLVAQSVSQKASATKISNTLKNLNRGLSPTTVNNYFTILEESLLFTFLPIYSQNVKNRLLYPRKVYCVDTGMAYVSQLSSKPIWGRLAENAVANKLFSIYKKDDMGYWKDPKGREIDFVIGRGDQTESLIQVVWDATNEMTLSREIASLKAGMEALGSDNALLITGVGKVPKVEGIRSVELFDYLLD